MSTFAEKALAYAESNTDAILKKANERQKEGQTSMSGTFMNYVEFKSGQGKVSSEHVPDSKVVKTSKGNSYYMKNAEVILTNVTPSDTISLNEDGTYTAKIPVRTKNGCSDTVLDYCRYHAEETSLYYDAESDTMKSFVTVKISTKKIYPVTIGTFNDTDFRSLKEIDTMSNKNKIRKGKSVSIIGGSFGILLSTYEKKKAEGDPSVIVFKSETSIKCTQIALDESKVQTLGDSPCAIYEDLYDKNNLILEDMKDIVLGDKKLPENIYIYTSASGKFQTEDLDRLSKRVDDLKMVLQNHDDASKETKIQARFAIIDIYNKKDQMFVHELMAYKEMCTSTGLDIENVEIWSDILMAHNFSSHFVCELDEKSTNAKTQNGAAVIQHRDNVEIHNHGVYVWSIKQWEIDWVDTLKTRAIEIDKDTFIQTFKDANEFAPKPKKFKISLMENGEKEYVFKSVLDYSNPIMNDGLYSKVIPFGSGSRPTIDCDDASDVINHPNAKFYALTGVPTESTDEWTTAEEGSEVFTTQITEVGVNYQLFVVQNLDGAKLKN